MWLLIVNGTNYNCHIRIILVPSAICFDLKSVGIFISKQGFEFCSNSVPIHASGLLFVRSGISLLLSVLCTVQTWHFIFFGAFEIISGHRIPSNSLKGLQGQSGFYPQQWPPLTSIYGDGKPFVSWTWQEIPKSFRTWRWVIRGTKTLRLASKPQDLKKRFGYPANVLSNESVSVNCKRVRRFGAFSATLKGRDEKLRQNTMSW